MSLRIADKSTCSADGFGWLEACTNLIILMMVMVTLIVMMMAIYVREMLTLMTLTGAENHLKSSLTGGSGQEGWWTIGSGENHKSSSLFSW